MGLWRRHRGSTGPRRSPSLRASMRSGSVRACTSGRQARRGCTISCGRWWTTLSTRPWPGIAAPSKSRCTPTGHARWPTTGAASLWILHPGHGNVPAVQIVLTVLHAGGKFGGGGYKISGGLHGVGVSVVNALSRRLEVEVRRGGQRHRMAFAGGGDIAEPLTVVGPGGRRRRPHVQRRAPRSGSGRTRRSSPMSRSGIKTSLSVSR